MTNKEAKHFLKEFLGDKPNFREDRPGQDEEVYRRMDMLAEAIDVAISALELVTINTESDEIKVTNCNNKNTIYRQAAIDAIASYERDSTAPINYRKIIEELPSAQPETAHSVTDSDLISRKAAIEALGEEPPVWYDGIDEISEQEQWRRDRAAIESVPSAQPDIARDIATIIENEKDMRVILSGAERKKGKWIEYIPEHGECPFCGNHVDLLNGKANNFCGECGADMRGMQDDS